MERWGSHRPVRSCPRVISRIISPGVTKIGEKTGIKLLLEHGSLEGIYENIDEMKASKMKENLINDKEQAFLSKKHWRPLISRHRLRLVWEDLVYSGPDGKILGNSTMRWASKQLKQALNVSSADVAES